MSTWAEFGQALAAAAKACSPLSRSGGEPEREPDDTELAVLNALSVELREKYDPAAHEQHAERRGGHALGPLLLEERAPQTRGVRLRERRGEKRVEERGAQHAPVHGAYGADELGVDAREQLA